MTCVVLGGSRSISRINDEIRKRLDRIVRQQFRVVVGDASGADKAFQAYLADRGYRDVQVFCSGPSARNNLGNWECRHVASSAPPGTFAFYAAKDQEMARAATVGFMLWDGKSVGTMLNVWRLLRNQKSSLVFLRAQREFREVRREGEWRALLELADPKARADIALHIKKEIPPPPELPLWGADLHSLGLV